MFKLRQLAILQVAQQKLLGLRTSVNKQLLANLKFDKFKYGVADKFSSCAAAAAVQPLPLSHSFFLHLAAAAGVYQQRVMFHA